MKSSLLIIIAWIASFGSVFSQCPEAGLKVQTADCEYPKNLRVGSASCSSLAVTWRGNKDQKYHIKTAFTDLATHESVDAEVSKITCDGHGNCAATIPVKEDAVVSWSVQAVCSTDGVTLYSSKVTGPDAHIPFCQERPERIKENAIQVYPNPASNYLNVRYTDHVSGPITFRIFDITGKKVYDRSGGEAVIKINNLYKLDLRNLLPGSYTARGA